jgi:hypothetical protein
MIKFLAMSLNIIFMLINAYAVFSATGSLPDTGAAYVILTSGLLLITLFLNSYLILKKKGEYK